jgi:hypothetical protein
MTKTYTIIDAAGVSRRSGLTAVEAVKEILGYDGYDFELRRAACGWQLYVSRFSRVSHGNNGGLVEAYSRGKLIYSLAETEDEAWEEIAAKMIASQHLDCDDPIAVPDNAADWQGRPIATADDEYCADC